jgi:hypothetical protein
MAKENEFTFGSSTIKLKEGIKAGFDLQTGNWEAKQDVSQYLKNAQQDRDREAYFGRKQNKSGFRKMATIPDIVAIKINEDHGIDLHDGTFMSDKDKMKKLKYILQTEYKHLLVNT